MYLRVAMRKRDKRTDGWTDGGFQYPPYRSGDHKWVNSVGLDVRGWDWMYRVGTRCAELRLCLQGWDWGFSVWTGCIADVSHGLRGGGWVCHGMSGCGSLHVDMWG